jgi:hypothetical protein
MILFLAMVILVQPSLRLLVWLVAGTDLFWERKYCWLVANGWFVPRQNTAGWLLISQISRTTVDIASVCVSPQTITHIGNPCYVG